MARKKSITRRLTQIREDSLCKFINTLTAHFGDLNKVPWENVYVEHDFDYSNCLYEGDLPGVELTFSLTFEEDV